MTNLHYKLNYDSELRLVMKGCPCAERYLLGLMLGDQSGGLCHPICKGCCSVADGRAENEVFGRAHQ